ncbi:hypothetical protein [Bartonella sp. TT121SHDZB]|uniref:hypothetical protein n=1 Tax=Bartonella sp. TT121SHDZB TaxID=3243580 RepID=UPI0035CF4E72
MKWPKRFFIVVTMVHLMLSFLGGKLRGAALGGDFGGGDLGGGALRGRLCGFGREMLVTWEEKEG